MTNNTNTYINNIENIKKPVEEVNLFCYESLSRTKDVGWKGKKDWNRQ